MKKIFVSAFVALSLFAFVACESNPGIKAGKDFLNDPTPEKLAKANEIEKTLTGDAKEEYDKWCEEHEEEILKAIFGSKK